MLKFALTLLLAIGPDVHEFRTESGLTAKECAAAMQDAARDNATNPAFQGAECEPEGLDI